MQQYQASTDGTDHINVSVVARTMLGLLLINGAYTPFRHPQYGDFVSVSGFRAWLITGGLQDVFRTMYGTTARANIANYSVVYNPEIAQLVDTAIELKIQQSPVLCKQFTDNRRLPYVSYGDDLPWHFQSGLEAWAHRDEVSVSYLNELKDKHANGGG
jgi:hypothetical protein